MQIFLQLVFSIFLKLSFSMKIKKSWKKLVDLMEDYTI